MIAPNLNSVALAPSPVSRRTIARRAAMASMVEASTPMRSPRTSPRSAIKARTQPNTVSCTSWGTRPRVFDSQEWSGTRSVAARRRNSRNENESLRHGSSTTARGGHAMIIRNNASHRRAPYIVNQTNEMRACTMRVVLADDHPIVLSGLRALLLAEAGVEIVAAALDGAIALEMIRAHEPEIAVLDIYMPRLTGLEVLEALEADGLATRVVLLTVSASDEQMATAVERGAWGLPLEEKAPGTLISCLKTVAAGQRWLPEELVAPAIR